MGRKTRLEGAKVIYKIKNWQDFQHYKDRAPAWIKLHASLLTSELWVMGNDASRTLAIACMLLASRNKDMDGTFNGDPEYIKRFAYLNSKPDFKPLISYGFIECVADASNALAFCTTEERREEERREESAPAKAVSFDFKKALLEAGANPDLVVDWLAVRSAKKAKNTKTAFDGFVREVKKSGFTYDQALRICCEKNWKGFDYDWVKDMKPVDTKPAVPAMSPEEHEAKRKADAAAAKERMRQEHAEFLRAQA